MYQLLRSSFISILGPFNPWRYSTRDRWRFQHTDLGIAGGPAAQTNCAATACSRSVSRSIIASELSALSELLEEFFVTEHATQASQHVQMVTVVLRSHKEKQIAEPAVRSTETPRRVQSDRQR